MGGERCPSLWGFHPHAPGYFLLVQKVTKNPRGGEGFRFPSPPRPPQYSQQEPRFTRGIAAATYAKNMPQAYFLNAAALARGATPRADLGAGFTTRSRVIVLHRHCDDHTAVCSRLGQFDSRPRGEWSFVEVGIRPLASLGGYRGNAPANPRAAAARCPSPWCATGPQVCAGGSPSGEGAEPP